MTDRHHDDHVDHDHDEPHGDDVVSGSQHDVAVRRLGQRLHAFSNIISGHYNRRTEMSFGVALPEWRVLQAVIETPEISQGEISMLNGLNAMTVSRAVAGLRDKGLVDTEPNPNDRRRSMLTATELGRSIASDIGPRASQMYAHVFSVLSEAELGLLDELMERINTFVQTTELPEPLPASRDWTVLLASFDETDEIAS